MAIKISGEVVIDNDKKFVLNGSTYIAGDNNETVFAQDGTESARIDSSGNVGIGTTIPTDEVDTNNTKVLNVGIVTANFYYGDGSKLSNVSVGQAGYWVQNNAGIHTLSNVGIGTTIPNDIVNITNTNILSVGIVTANEYYGKFIGDGSELRSVDGTNLVSYASHSQTSNTALNISGITTYSEVGIITGSKSVANDQLNSVSSNADGTTIVIGSRLSQTGGVSDTGIAYVFDRDGYTFNEVGILTGIYAENSNDTYGDSVVISSDGRTIAIGATNDEYPGGETGSGVVYVYNRGVGNAFTNVGILTGTYAGSGDEFGHSLAMSSNGKTIVVGAPQDEWPSFTSTNSGIVYVYDRGVGNSFSEVGILTGTHSSSQESDFGSSVAMSADGRTIIVGAPDDSFPSSATGSGVAYVYERSLGNTFDEVGILTGTHANDLGDSFGQSVAISADGKTIAVGAYLDELPGGDSNSGIVYVYDRGVGNTFTEVSILTGTYTGSSDEFGFSIAMSADGQTIVVGSPQDEVPSSNSNVGVTYVFKRQGSVFKEVSSLIGTYTEGANDNLGHQVAISADGKTIFSSAIEDESVGMDGGSGIIYVYDEVRETYAFTDTSGNIGIGTDIPTDAANASNTKILSVGIVTANEYYGDGSNLVEVESARGNNGDNVFYENDIEVTADYTITTGRNASSTGPISINDGVTVTIPEDSVWVIH